MTEKQLKRLHTAMCNDNEHQRNKLCNYIHTNVFSTAEVVHVVRGIVAEETKELQEENEGLRADVQNRLNVEVENIELKKQIADLKEYVLKVSKFLHNNSNVRPDKLAYTERDKLLIKELKLFEKWELSK